MAVEDGAVLAEVLTRAPDASPGAVGRRLGVYERLRKGHTTELVDLAAASGRALLLGRGPERDERDRQFAAGGVPIPDRWASPEVQRIIYSHDCMAEAAERFDELY